MKGTRKMKKLFLLFIALTCVFVPAGTSLAELPDGLLAYYPFNGNTDDESGNGFHGTPVGPGIGFTSGLNGSCVDINNISANSYIDIPHSGAFNLQTYTFLAWFKTNNPDGCLLSHGEQRSSDLMQYSLMANTLEGGRLFYCEDTGDGDYKLIPEEMTAETGSWYFVAVSRDEAGNMKLYLGNENTCVQLEDSNYLAPALYPSFIQNVTIGASAKGRTSTAYRDYYSGLIDDLRIYNRALSHVEISQVYDSSLKNAPPTAAPFGGGTYEINTPVTLSGNVSDFDGDTLAFEWLVEDVVLFSGTQPTSYCGASVPLPEYEISDLGLGDHTLVLKVDDGVNAPVSSSITVSIIDTTDPLLAPVPTKTILWPPNHKMVDIIIEANAYDNSGNPLTISASVASNEPQYGLDDDDMGPDWTEPVIDQDNGIISLQLRSERSGNGDGRVYTITITATDESNNTGEALLNIIVPHDRRKK